MSKELSDLEIQQILNSIDYSKAKAYYTNLKNQLYFYLIQKTNVSTANLFINELSTVIEQSFDLKSINDIIYKKLPESIENIVVKELQNKETDSEMQRLKNQYLALKNENTQEAQIKIKNILTEIIDYLQTTDLLMKEFKKLSKLNKKVVDFSDIKNQLPAFQKSVIKAYLNEESIEKTGSKGGSLAAVAGYFRESIVADAVFNYLTKNLEVQTKKFSVRQVGAIKIDSNSKKVDSPYDILFGAIFGKDEKQLAQDLESMSGIIDINNSLKTFGIQIKSASLPTRFNVYKDRKTHTIDPNKFLKKYSNTSTAFRIGSRAELYNNFIASKGETYAYHWTEGAKFLGEDNNPILALGPGNVMWVAGTEAMWTADFIETFSKHHMYLNFEFLLREKDSAKHKAFKGNNYIVLAYHNANLKSSLINEKKENQ